MFVLSGLFALVGMAACAVFNPAATPTPALEAVYTAAAQTVVAVLTQSAPVATFTPPVTPTPLLARTPSAAPTGAQTATPASETGEATLSPTPAPCLQAAFVRDVTLPDGTVVQPGGKLTKTWRLRNIGSCAWTPDFHLIFVQGALMNAPLEVPLGVVVFPGEEADLSVPLVAPTTPGTYRGYWRLRSAGGEVFGVGPGQQPFWVEIRVVAPSATP
ncbi:MAG TPA: hypothetical protein G4O04_05760 [Anaerolineae bacterium]|nr:hypothetical protein [Anaerolineae bacterium]